MTLLGDVVIKGQEMKTCVCSKPVQRFIKGVLLLRAPSDC